MQSDRAALEAALMNVSTPMMRGDNLAILLCSHFCDGEEGDDDCGWSPAAIAGYEEVKAALIDAAIAVLWPRWKERAAQVADERDPEKPTCWRYRREEIADAIRAMEVGE